MKCSAGISCRTLPPNPCYEFHRCELPPFHLGVHRARAHEIEWTDHWLVWDVDNLEYRSTAPPSKVRSAS